MATINENIERIKNSLANVWASLTDSKTALLTDQNNEHVHKIGSYLYFPAMSKKTSNGSTFSYLNSDFNDLYIHDKLGIGTPSPTWPLQIDFSDNTNAALLSQMVIRNTLATEGDGSTTFNRSQVSVVAGVTAVYGGIFASYESGGTFGRAINLGSVQSTTDTNIISANVPRITILHGGNVGIGTTGPATALDLGATGVITTAGGTSTQWNALLSSALKADGSVYATASLFFYNATVPATEIGLGYLKLNNTSDGSLLVSINQSNNTMPTHLGFGGNVELTDFDNFSDHTLSSSMLFFKRKLGTSDPTDGTLLGSILASSWNTSRSGIADGYSSPAVAINFVQDGANGSANTPGMIKFCTATNASLPLERMRINNAGGVFMYNIKSGTTQGGAGAAAHELWFNSSTNILMIGV